MLKIRFELPNNTGYLMVSNLMAFGLFRTECWELGGDAWLED